MSHALGLRPHQVIGYEYVPPNILINGDFEVWQRGTSFPSHYGFTADEWKSAGVNMSVVRSSSSKVGSYCLQATATSLGYVDQGIECGWSLSGLTLTFSVWVKTSTANAVRVNISDNSGSWDTTTSAYHTGSGSWERLTVVRTIRSGLTTPGTGPHLFPVMVQLVFDVAATAYFDGAMLVVGNFPEGVPFVPIHPADDMIRCQRFYQEGTIIYECPLSGVWTGSHIGGWIPPQNAGWWTTVTIYFNTRMASTPTLTWSSNSAHNIAYDSRGNLGSYGLYVTYDTTGAPGTGSTDTSGWDPTFNGDWTAYVP